MRRILFLFIALSISCGSSTPQNKPLTEETPVPEPTPIPAVAPDEGPYLTRTEGAVEHVQGESKKVLASRVFSDGTHAYVAFSVPVKAIAHLTSTIDTYGFVVEGPGPVSSTNEANLLIRFVGPQPKSFDLNVWSLEGRNKRTLPFTHTKVAVDTTSAKKDTKLTQEFRLGAADLFRLQSYGGADPFNVFASNRLRLLSGDTTQRRATQTDIGELMQLYTGYTSVQESLQQDRALLIRENTERQSIKLETIEGVPLAEHPWDEMLKELDSQAVIEPMAKVVPHDMLYVHMHDLRDFVKIAHDLDSYLTPLTQVLENNAGPKHFTQRYEDQLVVARTGLAESLGHIASDGIALTMGDPFLREGTDVSLVFRVKNRVALDGALTGFEQSLRASRNDVTVKEIEIDGTKVRVLSTPDGAARQHRVELGDLLILSNSPAAIAKFVAVHKGAKSIADDKGFAYMRTLYPFDVKTESGFVFVSDAFVAHAVSPRAKIAESRRLRVQADLYAVNYAALLFGHLEGRQPKNLDELIASGLLNKEELSHKDGTKISFTPETGSWSDYGNVAFLKPLAEWKIDKVTKVEQDAYIRFRETYQSYWQFYIDPIAVRLKRDGTRLRADVRVLPLIMTSDYNRLQRIVGDQRIQPPAFESGAVWAFGVGAQATLRREVDQMAQMFTGNGKISIGWLGDWVMAGAADRSGLWDAGLASASIPELEFRETQLTANSEFAKILQNFPVFVAAHVGNQLMLAATLTAVRTYVDQAAPNLIDWGQGDAYRDVPVVTIKEKDGTSEGAMGIQLHYAIVEDVLVAAFDRATLELQISAVLDGTQPKSVGGVSHTPEPADLQSVISMQLGDSEGLTWMGKTLLGLLEQGAMTNASAAGGSYIALQRGLARKLAPSDVRRMGLAYLGYEPSSVHGGTFAINDLGVGEHSIYGGPSAQIVPAVPVDGSPVTQAIKLLKFAEFAVGFSGRGQHLGLHARITWDRKTP